MHNRSNYKILDGTIGVVGWDGGRTVPLEIMSNESTEYYNDLSWKLNHENFTSDSEDKESEGYRWDGRKREGEVKKFKNCSFCI